MCVPRLLGCLFEAKKTKLVLHSRLLLRASGNQTAVELSRVCGQNICLKACSLVIVHNSDDVLCLIFDACVVVGYQMVTATSDKQ